MREFMLRAGQEGLNTAAALGHPILPIFGLDAAEVSRPDRVVETLLDKLYAGFVLPHSTTTVLQDWTKGRHSEVDDLNGYVVSAALPADIPTPINRAVVEVAHRIERGELEPAVENLRLFLALESEYSVA